MNPEKAGRVIESYKASTVAQYDPLSDLDYLIGHMQNTFAAKSDGKMTYYSTLSGSFEEISEADRDGYISELTWLDYHPLP